MGRDGTAACIDSGSVEQTASVRDERLRDHATCYGRLDERALQYAVEIAVQQLITRVK